MITALFVSANITAWSTGPLDCPYFLFDRIRIKCPMFRNVDFYRYRPKIEVLLIYLCQNFHFRSFLVFLLCKLRKPWNLTSINFTVFNRHSFYQISVRQWSWQKKNRHWERINAKPIVAILFFNIFDATGNFFCTDGLLRSTSSHKTGHFDAKKSQFTLNIVQNSTYYPSF